MFKISRFYLLLTALAVLPITNLCAQVTGFSVVKPVGVPNALLTLPGSVRRVALNCASGCSATNAANWTISSTSGGASATLIPSPTGNYVDVTVGPAAGSCPVTGASGSYTVTPTATMTLTATASNDPTKSDSVTLDVCNPAVEAYSIPFYRVLYAGQREDVQGVIWGSANTDGTWQIMSQPSGGDAVLDDTHYHDTVFHASVKGLYKVRWTSAADSSKTAYSTFYVTGNAQPRASQPNGTEPIDCTADPNTNGGILEVGPTQQYANLESIAPSAIVAGVTIRLHNEDTTGSSPTTYHEWIQINGAGTHDNPIRLCGVPDSAGHLPVMDGTNATARADILSPAYVSGFAGILVYNTNYDPYPNYTGPAYVVVEGLALRNYSPNNTFVPAGKTTGATTYNVGTSGFRFQNCRDCEFNGAEVSYNGNGVFAESNDSRAWGGVSERLLFEGNNVHDNGVTGDTHEHNWYLQGWFQVVQFNQMPTYNTAAYGSQYKDRGMSWFRYNLVGKGAQRMMDLVEDQDAANYLNPNLYLTSFRVAEPRDTYTGDQLAAAQEAWHNSETVYGNIFQQGDSGAIHFSGDNLGGYVLRSGKLDFYNNTANAVTSNGYRFHWFDTGDNGNNLPHYDWPTINVSNMVIGGFTDTASPYFSWNSQRDAFMNFSKVLLPITWGSNVQNCTDNSIGACDGTGWPYLSNTDAYFNGNAFNVTGAATFQGTSTLTPWNATTYQLITPVTGTPLTGSQAMLPVRYQYLPNLGYAIPRTTVVNEMTGGVIGATDSVTIAPTGPTVVPVTIALTPAPITLATQATLTLVCTTSLSDGSTRACLSPALTSSNIASATVSNLAVTATSTSGTGVIAVSAEGLFSSASFTVSGPTAPTVVNVVLSPSMLTLSAGLSATLACTTTLSDNTKRSCLSPTLQSSNPTSATVVGLVVTATNIGGSGTITATAEGFSTQSVFTVVQAKPVSIAVTPGNMSLAPRGTATLFCTTMMSDNTSRPCNTPTLISSNTASATVAGMVVSATNVVGSGSITATAEGLTAKSSFDVTRKHPLTTVAIALTPTQTTLTVGKTTSVYCTATLSNGTKRTCLSPTLSVANRAMASLSNLRITATHQTGNTELIMKAEGLTSTAALKVH